MRVGLLLPQRERLGIVVRVSGRSQHRAAAASSNVAQAAEIDDWVHGSLNGWLSTMKELYLQRVQ
jgi:hypothetical protein